MITRKWSDAFFNIAFDMAALSKDPSTKCGAVLVNKKNEIIKTGFNGPPPQIDDRFVPWNDRPQKYSFIIHAEENALLYALKTGVDLTNTRMFCTHFPCPGCVLRCIMHGITEFYIPEKTEEYKLSEYVPVSTWELLGCLKLDFVNQLPEQQFIFRLPYDRRQ